MKLTITTEVTTVELSPEAEQHYKSLKKAAGIKWATRYALKVGTKSVCRPFADENIRPNATI